MIEVENAEGLMVWLMHFLADRFGNSAVLKGGMELRLLNCPRHTNDIDYVFVPFSSEKDVARLVVGALDEVPDLRVRHTLNSKCLRCICEHNDIQVQLEINVAGECETEELTTADLARQYNLQGRIVRGIRFDVALAHKIAAWNERGLVRDIYDCSFMVDILGIRPCMPTLNRRLDSSQLRTGRSTRKVSMSVKDLVEKLRKTTASLSAAGVAEQMRDYLTPEELPGLDKKIRVGVSRLISMLEK
ncbi:MAG: hypothetical protein GF418_02945 [Chitinivibrionales bacterium]|nr:hypothetical protein [Chitinivibrionales bacterium]MBD3394559.1 hypothetical protein [Chitinivibrionales bacterium]